jgi:hypothetical protein
MKPMKISILVIFCVFNCFILKSQTQNINIISEKGIDELVNKHIEYNKEKNTISGYRLQIFFDSGNYSKSNAMNVRTKFIETYPNIKAYVLFNSPSYIVRVGNFRTRLEAKAFLHNIEDIYPEAYIVKDDIDLPSTQIINE